MTAKDVASNGWVQVLSALLGMVVIMFAFSRGITDVVDKRMDKFENKLVKIVDKQICDSERILKLELRGEVLDGKK